MSKFEINETKLKDLKDKVPKDLRDLVDKLLNSTKTELERDKLKEETEGLKKIKETNFTGLITYEDDKFKVDEEQVDKLKDDVPDNLHYLIEELLNYTQTELERDITRKGLKKIKETNFTGLIEYKDDEFKVDKEQVDKLKDDVPKNLHYLLTQAVIYAISELERDKVTKEKEELEKEKEKELKDKSKRIDDLETRLKEVNKRAAKFHKGLKIIYNTNFTELIEKEDKTYKVNEQKVKDLKEDIPNNLHDLVDQNVNYTISELERDKAKEGLKKIKETNFTELIEDKDDEFKVNEEKVNDFKKDIPEDLHDLVDQNVNYTIAELERDALTEDIDALVNGLKILENYKDIDGLTEQEKVDKLKEEVDLEELYFIVDKYADYAKVKKERDEFKTGLDELKAAITGNKDAPTSLPEYFQTIIENYNENREAEAKRKALVEGIDKIIEQDFADLKEEDEIDDFKRKVPKELYDIIDQYVEYEKRINKLGRDLKKVKKASDDLAKIDPADLIDDPEGLKRRLPPEYHDLIDRLIVLARRQPVQQIPVAQPQPYMMQPVVGMPYQPGQRGTLAVLYDLSARVGRMEAFYEKQGLPLPEDIKEVRERLDDLNPSRLKIKK